MTNGQDKGRQYAGHPTISARATGYFRVERIDGQWWLITPDGHATLSIGLNHLDDTDLRYPHNFDVWKSRYGSRPRWIEAVTDDLTHWGFNTIGWTRQWVSERHHHDIDWVTPLNLGHGHEWSVDELRGTDMPYVLQLTVASIEGWNGNPHWPDVFSSAFDDHCAWIARQYCSRVADDPMLVGYFLSDIPSWLPHAAGGNFAGLPGSAMPSRAVTLADVAEKYYATICGHIRRYDPHHLILGDRYNGNMGIPEEVLRAAAPYIDVLSVQYFPGNDAAAQVTMRDHLAQWSSAVDRPVLVADIGNCAPTPLNPDRDCGLADHAARGRHYVDALSALVDQPWFIGWHWCSYLENTARGWGLKDGYDEPYGDLIEPLRAFNHQALTRRSTHDRL